jgi:hypothetical protein
MVSSKIGSAVPVAEQKVAANLQRTGLRNFFIDEATACTKDSLPDASAS